MKETQQRNLLLYIVTQLPFQCGDLSCVQEMEFPHLFTAFVALWLLSQSSRPNRGISPHARHAQRQNWLDLGMTLHAHNSLGPLNSLRRSRYQIINMDYDYYHSEWAYRRNFRALRTTDMPHLVNGAWGQFPIHIVSELFVIFNKAFSLETKTKKAYLG